MLVQKCLNELEFVVLLKSSSEGVAKEDTKSCCKAADTLPQPTLDSDGDGCSGL